MLTGVSNQLDPCGPGATLPFIYPFTSPIPHLVFYVLVYFTLFFFYYLYLLTCYSIASHSTRIVPLHFQAGCRRRRLNLALLQ